MSAGCRRRYKDCMQLTSCFKQYTFIIKCRPIFIMLSIIILPNRNKPNGQGHDCFNSNCWFSNTLAAANSLESDTYGANAILSSAPTPSSTMAATASTDISVSPITETVAKTNSPPTFLATPNLDGKIDLSTLLQAACGSWDRLKALT